MEICRTWSDTVLVRRQLGDHFQRCHRFRPQSARLVQEIWDVGEHRRCIHRLNVDLLGVSTQIGHFRENRLNQHKFFKIAA